MILLIPAPYVQPNLHSTCDWHTGMDRLFVPFAVGIEILPENGAPFTCFERHTLCTPIALDELAPSIILWHLQPWKICLERMISQAL